MLESGKLDSLTADQRRDLAETEEGRELLAALPLARELNAHGCRGGLDPAALERGRKELLRQVRSETEAAAERRPWFAWVSPKQLQTLAWAGAAVVCLLLGGWGVSAFLENRPIGSVYFSQADLSLPGAQPAQFKPGSGSLKLDRNARLESGAGGGLVQVQAGVELALAGKSQASLVTPRLVRLDEGEIWLDVEPGHGRFEVETPDFRVEVKGTSFGVSSRGGTTRVHVTTGHVVVSPLPGKGGAAPVDLIRGQAVTFDGNHADGFKIEAGSSQPRWFTDLHNSANLALESQWVPSTQPNP